jgi:hypothetical protein
MSTSLHAALYQVVRMFSDGLPMVQIILHGQPALVFEELSRHVSSSWSLLTDL